MNPTPPTIDAPERREADYEAARERVRRIIYHQDCRSVELDDDFTVFVRLADLRALLAASSGEREKALEEAARVADDYALWRGGSWKGEAGQEIAAIIRALATPASVEEGKV